MIKIRKLVETTLDDPISKRLSKPTKNGDIDFAKICQFVTKHFKKELSSKFERMVILTLEDTVIIRAYLIGIGNEDHVITYGREIVQYAIEDNANTVITIHNHPHILENLTISSADIATMSQQTSALGFIGIRVHMGIVKSDLSQFKFYFSQEDRPEFDITCKTKREKLEDGEKYNIESYTIEKKCKPFDLSYIDLHMIPRAKRVRKDAPNVSKSTSNSHKNDVTEDRTTSEINLKIGETE